jgi:hypothetical protein
MSGQVSAEANKSMPSAPWEPFAACFYTCWALGIMPRVKSVAGARRKSTVDEVALDITGMRNSIARMKFL